MTESDASVIAPDTRGMNFFRGDHALQDLLALYLPQDLLTHLTPYLDRLGGLAAGELDECAALADRHPPQLHPRDRFGRDREWIEYHPAYRRLEQVAYGEFGIHAMSHRPILGWAQPLPAVAKHAFTLLFNEAEFGLGCPINVTDSAAHLLIRFGDDAVKARFLPRMLSQDMDELWQGAQFMTEKSGGSDVGSLTSTAVLSAGQWRIHGEKWFCSNADADVVTLLARPDGAPAGTRGLGLFVMPRLLENGAPNRYRIIRLKDKLGTRSMASGEVRLDGAVAYPLGQLDAGFKQMAEMINWSRLSNGVKSTALMRRAVQDAWQVYRHRQVFGSSLLHRPLAQRQLLKLQLPSEQALSMSFFTAHALDQAEYPGRVHSNDARAVLRLATPVLKARATRDARRVTGDAMEVRGGCGYIEEFVNPRLLRDAHLGSIWEGTSNIVAIDAIRRAVGRNGCQGAYQAALLDRLDQCAGLPEAFVGELRRALQGAIECAEASDTDDELCVRQAVTALYHASSAILLAWEGCAIAQHRGDGRRVLWARLTLDHRLYPQGPLQRIDRSREAAIAGAVLGAVPLPLQRIAPLLG
jgi:alkylation response protein AidB-like acyl-CoA dehydrogenase